MAVASDLPELEEPSTRNSVLVDRRGEPLGRLTGNQRRILVRENQIAPVMKHAIIAIEDKRFYTNDGVDLRGIGRALYQDVRGPEGGPGRLDDHPAVRQERARRPGPADAVREAARGRDGLPPDAQVDEAEDPAQLPQLDLLRQRRVRDRVGRAHVLRQPAHRLREQPRPPVRRPARARRGRADRRRGRLAERLRPDRPPGRRQGAARPRAPAHARAELHRARAVRRGRRRAAALARRHPAAARGDEVPLLHVLDQAAGRRQARRRADRRPPGLRGRPDDPDDDRLPLPGGGRRRDLRLAALAGRPARLARGDRQQDRRGRAMVGGDDYNTTPFNLATQGQRQPGSAFKPFILAEALKSGHLPDVAVVVAQEGLRRPRLDREVHGRELQRRLRRRHDAGQRDHHLGQLRVRRGRHQGRDEEGRRSWRAGWASARRSRTTGR